MISWGECLRIGHLSARAVFAGLIDGPRLGYGMGGAMIWDTGIELLARATPYLTDTENIVGELLGSA